MLLSIILRVSSQLDNSTLLALLGVAVLIVITTIAISISVGVYPISKQHTLKKSGNEETPRNLKKQYRSAILLFISFFILFGLTGVAFSYFSVEGFSWMSILLAVLGLLLLGAMLFVLIRTADIALAARNKSF